MGIFKKKLWRQKRKSDKKAKGRANRAVIEQLEPRLLLAADLVVNAAAAVDLTVKLENTISGPTVQVVNNEDQSLVDSQLLSETSRVVINGSGEDDSVTIDLEVRYSEVVTLADGSRARCSGFRFVNACDDVKKLIDAQAFGEEIAV